MAILQPQNTDYLNSPDHAFLHRVFATDGLAPVQSIVVNSSGNVGIGTTDPSNSVLRVAVPYAKTDTTHRLAASFGSNEAVSSNPFVLRIGIIGGAALANRVATLQTTDVNSADGGSLALQAGGGNVGIGITAPTAVLHLKAATATANTASLKIDPGVVATTPVSGNIESDGTNLYWTDSGGTRRQLNNA